MRTLSIAIIGMLIAGSGLAYPIWVQLGQDIDGVADYDFSGSSVSLSTDGNIVAIGASGNDGNGDDSGHVRIYQWNETQWIQRGNDIDGEAEYDSSGFSVSLSTDGNIVAIGATGNDGNGNESGQVRIYQLHFDSDGDGVSDVNDQCADTLAGQTVNSNGCDAFQQLELVNQQLQALQAQVTDISLTPGPQGPIGADGSQGPVGTAGANGTDGAAGANGTDGTQGPQGPIGADGSQGPVGAAGANGTDGTQGPQGKVGATGADADCVACVDVANGAVELACLVLGENLPTRVGQVQAAATVIVNTLLISTNICETDCNIGAEIDALIDAKMNP